MSNPQIGFILMLVATILLGIIIGLNRSKGCRDFDFDILITIGLASMFFVGALQLHPAAISLLAMAPGPLLLLDVNYTLLLIMFGFLVTGITVLMSKPLFKLLGRFALWYASQIPM